VVLVAALSVDDVERTRRRGRRTVVVGTRDAACVVRRGHVPARRRTRGVDVSTTDALDGLRRRVQVRQLQVRAAAIVAVGVGPRMNDVVGRRRDGRH